MKKDSKPRLRLGNAATAGLVSAALLAAPLTTLVAATPALAEATLPPSGSDTQLTSSVAQTGDGNYFSNLQDAINWANSDDVTLLKDVDEHVLVASNNTVTLDLNGHRIAHNNNESAIDNEGTLTIKDDTHKGSVFGTSSAVTNNQGGKLYIHDGTFEGRVGGNAVTGEGEIKIYGGTFSNDVTAYAQGARSVVALTSGGSTTYAVDESSNGFGGSYITNLVKQAKTGDVITVSQVANNDQLILDTPGGANVTVINNSKGKVKLTSVILEPGERSTDEKVSAVSMYRLYNPNSGEHFYTASKGEHDYLVKVGWKDEGTGWIAPSVSSSPVYRLYNPNAGDHHYTLSIGEKDYLVAAGWKDEGIGWYSDDSQQVPLYRQYNPNAKAGAHNFTTAKEENDYLVSVGWKAEGIGWYGMKPAADARNDAKAKDKVEKDKTDLPPADGNQDSATTLKE